MRYVTLSFGALVAATSVAAPQTDKDAAALQGVWRGVYGETSRERLSPEDAKGIRLIFKGDLVTMRVGKEELIARSEERRVGKERRDRGWYDNDKQRVSTM